MKKVVFPIRQYDSIDTVFSGGASDLRPSIHADVGWVAA